MKTIVWIVDVPGWAYNNRAMRIKRHLPDYNHVIVFNIVRERGKALNVIRTADVIVCPDPRLLKLLPYDGRIVQNVNAIKIFK